MKNIPVSAICKVIFVLATCLFLASVQGGTACSETTPKPDSTRKAFASAHKTHMKLEEMQPKVALLARVGQDLSQYGLRYSHVAVVMKEPVSGQWRVNHLLNACGTNSSALWQEGLANFFLDDLHAYDALIMVPSPALQDRLAITMGNPTLLRNLHQPQYNMLAYPFSKQYQNSNQWVLEIVTVALSRQAAIASRDQAQQWLKLTDYKPATLKLGAFTRLGARMFRANVAFDDHPNERRFADLIDTVTVESIVDYLKRMDTDATSIVIREQ